MKQTIGYLRLMRPANIVTAISDVLAGFAIAYTVPLQFFSTGYEVAIPRLIFLILSTIFLYGGGVVLNDVFDAELDKTERPERPIPSGLIKKSHAAWFGTILLVLGIVAAAMASSFLSVSTLIATAIAIAAVLYDSRAKHHPFFGPLTMGVCRGLNLMLGMSIMRVFASYYSILALAPLLYIFAITMISRGEVHGGKRTTLYVAALLYLLVIVWIQYVAFTRGTLGITLPFIAFFALMIFIPLQKAIIKPEGPRIGKAVKFGVISLIIMNASWAATFDNLALALIILALLPVSLLLARLFAVT